MVHRATRSCVEVTRRCWELHALTGAGDDFGPRFVACFIQAADDAELQGDVALRDALCAYMTWAVAEVLSYAPEDAQVPMELPLRHWTWGGLE